MGHRIVESRDEGNGHWTIRYVDDDGAGHAHSVPHDAVPNRMAAYAMDDPAEALSVCLHEAYWERTKPEDHRDDPATVEGWVTSTDPDAEPVHLYNARSGADAAGAHRARLAVAVAGMGLTDPDGLLPLPDPSPDRVRFHQEMTDTYRWVHVYGDLPEQPRSTRPGTPTEDTDA